MGRAEKCDSGGLETGKAGLCGMYLHHKRAHWTVKTLLAATNFSQARLMSKRVVRHLDSVFADEIDIKASLYDNIYNRNMSSHHQ